MTDILRREWREYQKSLPLEFLKHEGSPSTIIATAATMWTTIFVARYVPWIEVYFGFSSIAPPVILVGVAAMTSVVSWVYTSNNELDRVRIVQIFDYPLWGFVPISLALCCREQMGVAISITVHGLMAIHWSRLTRNSAIFNTIVFGPPVALFVVAAEHPWVFCQGLIMCLMAVLFSRFNNQKFVESERREVITIRTVTREAYAAASRREKQFLAAKIQKLERTLEPATMVRDFLKAAERDHDVAVLCSSLDRAVRFIRAMACNAVETSGECSVGDLLLYVQRERSWLDVSIELLNGYTTIGVSLADAAAILEAILVVGDQATSSKLRIASVSEGGLVTITFEFGDPAVRQYEIDGTGAGVPYLMGLYFETARRALRELGGDIRVERRLGVIVFVMECPTVGA